jgi:hypothetical protein
MSCIASRWMRCCASGGSTSALPRRRRRSSIASGTDSCPGPMRFLGSPTCANATRSPRCPMGTSRGTVDMARYSALPWDCILSAELARAYKPDPRVYQLAITLLGLSSQEVMMVAAHQEDLRAAQAQGMQAAFVPRSLEHGPEHVPDLTPDPSFQIVATDLSPFGAATRRLKPAHHTYARSSVTNTSAACANSSQSAACAAGTSTHAFIGRPCIGSKSRAPGSASALVCAAPPSLKTIAS